MEFWKQPCRDDRGSWVTTEGQSQVLYYYCMVGDKDTISHCGIVMRSQSQGILQL